MRKKYQPIIRNGKVLVTYAENRETLEVLASPSHSRNELRKYWMGGNGTYRPSNWVFYCKWEDKEIWDPQNIRKRQQEDRRRAEEKRSQWEDEEDWGF